MNYDQIFEAYYTLYRAEAETPPSSDEEYVTGIRLANEAISRWVNYDNTFWNELYTTLGTEGQSITVSSNTTYAGPTNMRSPGGHVIVRDDNGNTLKRYPLIEPHQVQMKGDTNMYCTFTGNAATGFSFTVNPSPDEAIQGKTFDFMYYRNPTLIQGGGDVPDMRNPYFIVNRMLANRFRASRNWSAYQTAMRDAEEALKVMQLENNSGTWSNPWKLEDNSGTIWGL